MGKVDCGECVMPMLGCDEGKCWRQKESSALPACYKDDLLIMTSRLMALLDGLEVPNATPWLEMSPEKMKLLGQAIAAQAKKGADQSL